MADGVQIQLQGADDIVAALNELRDFLPRTYLRKALRSAAAIMQADIESRAPSATGKLRENITVRVRRTAETLRARVVVNTKGKADSPDNAFYWRFVEFGHSTRGGAGQVAPHPFVTPAFEGNKSAVAQQVISAVEEAITKAERKAKRTAKKIWG